VRKFIRKMSPGTFHIIAVEELRRISEGKKEITVEGIVLGEVRCLS